MNILPVGDAVPRRGNKVSQAIGQGIFRIFGWRIEGELPNEAKFVVIGAPHTSNWDFILTMLTMIALKIRIYWMAKDSLFGWPYGMVMRWLGGLAIDRSSTHGVVDQMVAEFERRDKLIVCIVPEGTRKKVNKWKTGFYHIAQGANVPIVLVSFDYEHKTMGFGPTITATGNIEADVEHLQAFCANIKGKYAQ